ncbi:MAG: HDIG domain-containing protein [Ignavibacteriaceae bacterium]
MASEPNKTSVKTTIFRIIIALTTVALIALMFPKGESIESEVTEGSIWLKDDLIAPFSFPIIKSPDVYRRQIAAAERTVYPVFIEKNEIENISIDSLQVYNTYLTDIIDQNISSDSVETINPTFLSTATFKKFQSLRTRERNLIDVKGPKLKELFAAARVVLTKIYKAGILNIDSGKESKDSIAVRVGNVDRIKAISDFMFINNARDEVAKEVGRLQYPNDVGSALAEYTSHFVFPNLIYSSDLTDEEKEQARDNVSKYSGIVNENERIVAKHDRITKEIKFQYLGKFIHIGLLLLLLSIYLYLFRKKIFYDNNKLILIAIIFTFVTFVTFLINQIKVEAPVQLLIFIPAASMLFTIIFDSRVGFYTTIILALITGALRGNDYSFTTINLIAGGLSVYTVRDIKNRSQIFRSFLVILAGYFVSIIAFGLERFAPIETMLVELAFAASNALISPVLTYGLLIFFEKLFRITTDLTLLELSNFDRPLLKDLARKAPGTFNHSMTMGTMAEAAAETISANPLLARVGAYYHDIGKTITPQNYVENQLNNQNVHENLTPEESASLIASHVREGVQLAQDNDLPQEIIDFIPMHHGTTTMTYFYERAKKLYGENKVDINQYRYPGPKPQTKETAIVMLADGCESAVRSIEDADSKKVENVIDGILNARISDGQLNEAPITFSDIAKLKETFLGILLGQRHKRIRYPKQEEIEKGENKAEEK